MKISLAQIEVKGSIEDNLDKIVRAIRQNGASDIVVFPELALTGYDLDFIASLDPVQIQDALCSIQKEVKRESQVVVVGTPRTEEEKLYNSAAVISKDKILFYDKINLTEKDKNIFHAGKKECIFEGGAVRFGVLICRDQNDVGIISHYKGKIDIMLHLSAHYYLPEIAIKKLDKNIALPIARAIDCACLWIKVNTVGWMGDEVSLGSSVAVTKDGIVMRRGNRFAEEFLTLNTEEL